jgi:hypothetical protein
MKSLLKFETNQFRFGRGHKEIKAPLFSEAIVGNSKNRGTFFLFPRFIQS